MKKLQNYFYLLLAVAAGNLAATGCNQPEENTSDVSTNTRLSAENVLAETDDGCCGKCTTEQVATETDGGCCGKCVGEEAAASTSSGKTETCQNGCNDCAEGDSAEGDSANCKCGDVPDEKTKSSPAKDSEADSNADTHVNTMPEDRVIFHYLLENHEKISRTVTELDNGVKTVTESTDPAITDKIQEHVASMYKRVEDGRPLRMWDELYREIFMHADKINMEIENTEKGISVTETSDDEYVVKLIQSHAKVVSGFAKRGFDEARENHAPPAK